MTTVYLSIGSNIEREKHIRAGINALKKQFGNLTLSSVYESDAVGFDGQPFLNLIAAFVFSFCIFSSDKIIYGSESSRKWWFKFFPWIKMKNSKIIHNGICLHSFKKRNKNKVKNISFVGRVEHENDPEFFCKLARSTNLSKTNSYKFHVFGDGSVSYTHLTLPTSDLV